MPLELTKDHNPLETQTIIQLINHNLDVPTTPFGLPLLATEDNYTNYYDFFTSTQTKQLSTKLYQFGQILDQPEDKNLKNILAYTGLSIMKHQWILWIHQWAYQKISSNYSMTNQQYQKVVRNCLIEMNYFYEIIYSQGVINKNGHFDYNQPILVPKSEYFDELCDGWNKWVSASLNLLDVLNGTKTTSINSWWTVIDTYIINDPFAKWYNEIDNMLSINWDLKNTNLGQKYINSINSDIKLINQQCKMHKAHFQLYPLNTNLN